MIRAVIFDVDGTLIDTVRLHAESFARTFQHFGIKADQNKIRRYIGMAAGPLLRRFVPPGTSDSRINAIEQFRSELFRREYLDQTKAFPGVRELLKLVRSRGQKIGLASSCRANELGQYKKIADISDLIDAEATSDDADCSKPAPDVLLSCLARLGGHSPGDVCVVGDTSYDAEAANKIGATSLGLLCGAGLEPELRQAGCVAVYRHPEDLLRNYDTSPLREAPRRADFPTPPAGPHARRALVNPDATPGTGVLPPVDSDNDGNMQPTG